MSGWQDWAKTIILTLGYRESISCMRPSNQICN